MVVPTEFEYRKSLRVVSGVTSLGLDIDMTAAGLIDPKGENNLFDTAQTAEVAAGSTKYRLIYVLYTGVDKPIKNCGLGQFTDTVDSRTRVSFANDPNPSKYIYHPPLTFNGTSDRIDQADDPTLRLTVWTITAWFRTSKADYTTEGAICSKGGFGSETAGQNTNYGLWMDANEKIVAGFETGAGVDNLVISPLTYNDGIWHLAIATYDGSNLKLYIDGVQTPVATLATSSVPETVNTNPLTLGANPRGSDRFFQGDIDQVKVHNRALLPQEVDDYYNLQIYDSTGIVYTNGGASNSGARIGQALTNETTAPSGSPVWLDVSNGPPLPPNIGEFRTGMYWPILVRYVITAMNPPRSIENDLSVVRTYYQISQGQTGGGGEGGGNSGGGTGGEGGGGSDVVNRNTFFNSDSGEGNSTMDDLVSLSVSKGCDVNAIFVVGGDCAYSGKITGFLSGIKPVDDKQGSNRSMCRYAVGNHDVEGSKEQDLRSHIGVSKNYYSFDRGNIHVLVLDSENSPTGSAQKNFADADLKAASESATTDWIFVTFHRPLYTADNSHHDSDESNMRSTYHPMFDKYGVDLLLLGHVHSVQVTYPISNNKDNSPNIVTKTSGPYDFSEIGHGCIQIVNGTLGHDSGGALYKLDNTPSYNQYQNDSDNMMVKLATSNNGKTLTIEVMNQDGSVKKTLVINKQA